MAEKKSNESKILTVADVIKKMNAKHGEGSISIGGAKPVKRLSSGILALDLALGGGWPVGKIIEIYGPEATGKTAIAIQAAIECQKQGRLAALIDYEHAFDKNVAMRNGLDVDSLIYASPYIGEEGFDYAENLALTGDVGLIIFDSVVGAVPMQDMEKNIGDLTIGTHARFMGSCIKRMVPTLNKNECTMIFINQLREKVGVMYGNPETTPGGKALKFFASVRLDTRIEEYIGPNGKSVKTKKEAIGHKSRVNTAKNKFFPPFKQAMFDFYYGIGVDRDRDLVTVSKDLGVIDKSGTWLAYADIKEQGEANFLMALREKPLLYEEIKEKTYAKILETSKENGGSFIDEDSENGDPTENY